MRSTDFITVHDFESREPCHILPSAIIAVTQLAETGRCKRRTKIDLTGGHVIVTDKTASEVMAIVDAADNRSRRSDAAATIKELQRLRLELDTSRQKISDLEELMSLREVLSEG